MVGRVPLENVSERKKTEFNSIEQSVTLNDEKIQQNKAQH
jgi:hypothetical protein